LKIGKTNLIKKLIKLKNENLKIGDYDPFFYLALIRIEEDDN
jgi:ABC-type uncharacterized transport system substrate-binding protein